MYNVYFGIVFSVVFMFSFLFIDYGVNAYLVVISHFVFLIMFSSVLRSSLAQGHYLSIDILFFIFFYIVFLFPYALNVLGIFDLVSARYVDYVFIDYSNMAISISMVGVCAYFAGSKYQSIKLSKNAFASLEKPRNPTYGPLIKFVFACQLCFFGLFMASGFSNLTQGAYAGTDTGTNTENGVYFLVTHFCLMSIGLIIANLALKRGFTATHYFSAILVLVWMMLLLVFGDRNMFFLIGISIFSGYVVFVKKIPFKIVVIYSFFALLLYEVVEYTRMSNELSYTSMVDSYIHYKSLGDDSQMGSGSFYNTTVSLRASLEFAENNELFWGKFKIIGLLGIIPFSRSLFVNPEDPYIISADVLTETVLGPAATWGIGTNIISDIYLDFGMVGVFILMGLLGVGSGYISRLVSLGLNDAKVITLFIMTIALYSQIARYTFDFPVRNIAWTLIVFFIYEYFTRDKRAAR